MTITITRAKPKNIISIPIIYATLLDTNSLFYRYSITYEANPVSCIRENAYIVKIQARLNNATSNLTPTVIKNSTGYEQVNNIRRFGATRKSAGQVTPTNIASITSDISTRIPNTAIRTISNLSKQVNTITVSTQKELVTRPVEQLARQNINSPVLIANVNNPSTVQNNSVNQVTVPNLVRTQMNRLLFNGAIDPASLTSARTNTVVYPQRTVAGTIPSPPYTRNSIVANNPAALNILASQLTTSFAPRLSQQINLNTGTQITVLENVNKTTITITETLDIPIGKLGVSDFYLIFDVVNSEGEILQTETKFINHGANISNVVPVEPPTLKCGIRNNVGRAKFEIKQNDPNAKGVLIYRREINPTIPIINSKYDLIQRVPLLAGKDPILYEDKISTVNNVIYRVVPYISDQLPGPVFSSIPIRFRRENLLKTSPMYRRQVCGILTYNILQDSIQVNVSKYPVDAICIKLFRRNKSIFEKKWRLVGTSNVLRANTTTAISFYDRNVTLYKNYEYKAVMIYPDGTEEAAYNNLLLEYRPIASKIAKTTISNPTITTYNGIPTVTFNVEYSLIEDSFELIKKLIIEQNFLSEYEVNIVANKERLKTLLSYSVTRLNLTTGDIEYFGTIPSTTFNDRLYGLSRSVKDLDMTNEYQYKVTTYVRSPETLMPNLVRTVNTTVENKPVSYQLKPFKWYQPVTLNEGNIVTERSLVCNYPQDQMSQGRVVDIVETPKINLLNPLPRLTNVNATKISRNSILIEWKVEGDLTKIDHFVIKLEMYNNITIVGNVHNASANNAFKFLDPLTNGEQGPLTYQIVPIYYDYTQGSPAKTRTVNV